MLLLKSQDDCGAWIAIEATKVEAIQVHAKSILGIFI
jgi:hypothetical protein